MRAALVLSAVLLVTNSTQAGLIGFYSFDDESNLGLDSSGHGNHATNAGTGFTPAGYQNGAASFDGASYLRVPIDVNVAVLPNMSWGAWANPSVVTSINAVLSADDGDFDRNLNIDHRGGGTWSAFTGLTSPYVQGSGVLPVLSQWVFLAVTYDNAANSATLYVDNLSINFNTAFGPFYPFFDIGRNPGHGEFFYGAIDNVFVFDETLSADRIADIRANGINVAEVPEPASMVLLTLGGCAAYRWRRRSAA